MNEIRPYRASRFRFHRRVREGFADMAAADPNRWYVVDASTPADETAATIRKVVSERLGI